METISPSLTLRRKAMALLLLATPMTPALACTTTQGGGDFVQIRVDVPMDKVNAPYGEVLALWKSVFNSGDRYFVDGCDRQERVPFQAFMQNHGFRRYGTLYLDGYTYTTFELANYPNTPLFIFQHSTRPRNGGVGGYMQPVWDLSGIDNPGFTPPAGGVEGRDSLFYVSVVARGIPMRGIGPTTLGEFIAWPRNYPSLKLYSGLAMSINVPRATCTLSDKSVPLPDASATELSGPNTYARETPFDIAMNCDINDGSFVRLTITDALDASNRLPELTPSTDSTTSGVRLQIGRRTGDDHDPIYMGSSWTQQVRQGTTLIPFFARYYRFTGAPQFRSGNIDSKATLTLTYM